MHGVKPNVFLFVVDTLQHGQVRGCGAPGKPANFLERALQMGTLLENYFPAGGTTRVSVNALGNGFFGGTTGLNHQQCHLRFDACEAITMAEVFRHHGYRTLGMTQGDISLLPRGLDEVWTRQERFTGPMLKERLACHEGPTFTYLHFYEVHDAAFGQPGRMTPPVYRQHLNLLAEEMEEVWKAVVGPEDVVVLTSDHGCRLRANQDPDWRFFQEDEPTAGTFLSEKTIRGVCSLIGPGRFPSARVSALVRGIDIFPTLFDAIGLKRPAVQGQSIWSALQGQGPWIQHHAFSETGGIPLADGSAASRCVRTPSAKLISYAVRGEELYDLGRDPDEQDNLIGTDHPAEDLLRAKLDSQMAENQQGVESFYRQTPELVAQIWQARRPAPAPRRGTRKFALTGIIDDQVRDYLRAVIHAQLAGWQKKKARIVLCSASDHARAFLEAAGPEGRAHIVGIADRNPGQVGPFFEEFPVCSYEDLVAVCHPTMVLVAHHHYQEDILIRLLEVLPPGIPRATIYHPARIYTSHHAGVTI